MVPLNSLAAGHENVGYVEIDGKYHPLRIFHAVAGVPEDRHTCIITWPSDDAKSHDATARLKEFLVAGDIKRDFDHNHTPRTPSTRPSAARASKAAARRTRSSTGNWCPARSRRKVTGQRRCASAAARRPPRRSGLFLQTSVVGAHEPGRRRAARTQAPPPRLRIHRPAPPRRPPVLVSVVRVLFFVFLPLRHRPR